MGFTTQLIAADWLVAAWPACLWLLWRAVRQAAWRRFVAAPATLHLFLASVVLLGLLWSLRAGVVPGLPLHFLGLTTVTLMFGWEFGMIAASLALFALGSVGGGGGTAALALNMLVGVALPIGATWGVHRLVERRLPPHVFGYIYLCGFFGGVLAALACAVGVIAVLGVNGAYTLADMRRDYLAYLPLLAFPEGLLNGMLVTAFVMLRPEWLWTYSDARYLRGK